LNLVNYEGNLNKTLDYDIPKEDMDKMYLFYRSTDKSGVETIRLTAKPSKILLGKKEIKEVQVLNKEGYTWVSMQQGGLLKVRHETGGEVAVYK